MVEIITGNSPFLLILVIVIVIVLVIED